MSRWQEDLYGKGWNSVYWSNHDQPRTVSRYGDDSPKFRKVSAKMLGTVLHLMSGTPYIYQGEELGMTNKHFDSIDQFNDLMAKFHYQKMMKKGISPSEAIDFLNDFSRDHARVPMHWDASDNAGFTSGKPWLPLNDNYVEINADESQQDADSIYHYYRRLIALRKGDEFGDVIVYGKPTLLDPNDDKVYAYLREYQGKKLLIIANFSAESLQRSYPYKMVKSVLSNVSSTFNSVESITLEPYGAYVVEVG
jgi:oligo-1,6-glucosidase